MTKAERIVAVLGESVGYPLESRHKPFSKEEREIINEDLRGMQERYYLLGSLIPPLDSRDKGIMVRREYVERIMKEEEV